MDLHKLRVEPIVMFFAIVFFIEFLCHVPGCEQQNNQASDPVATATVEYPNYDETPLPTTELTPQITMTPTPEGTPNFTLTPTPTVEVLVTMDAEAVASDSNFISGQTAILDIPYTIIPETTGTITWTVEAVNTDGNNQALTAAVTGIDFSIGGHLRFYPQHTGSSTEGLGAEPEGLEYRLRCYIDNNQIQEFVIEQDDINRARQEFSVFSQPIPNRNQFPGVVANIHVGTPATFYGTEAFLERGYANAYTQITNNVGAVTVSSTWRNPYFNTSIGSAITSDHCTGKAIDTQPNPNTQETFKNRWNSMSDIWGRCLLERNAAILRNTDFVGPIIDLTRYNISGWRVLPVTHQYYDDISVRFYDFIPEGNSIEIGYQEATHYHNNE